MNGVSENRIESNFIFRPQLNVQLINWIYNLKNKKKVFFSLVLSLFKADFQTGVKLQLFTNVKWMERYIVYESSSLTDRAFDQKEEESNEIEKKKINNR